MGKARQDLRDLIRVDVAYPRALCARRISPARKLRASARPLPACTVNMGSVQFRLGRYQRHEQGVLTHCAHPGDESPDEALLHIRDVFDGRFDFVDRCLRLTAQER